MDVMEAIAIAKKYVGEIFAEERATDVALEEIAYDEQHRSWDVTIGFSRPSIPSTAFDLFGGALSRTRTYKIVRISDPDGTVKSIKDRFLQPRDES